MLVNEVIRKKNSNHIQSYTGMASYIYDKCQK